MSADHRMYARASTSAEEERPIMAERYKTKMCKNYVATGVCRYDIRCMFAHGEHELRTPEQNVQDGLVTEEAIKAMQHQVQMQQRGEARHMYANNSHNNNNNRLGAQQAMLPPPPPFHEDHALVEMAPLRVAHNPYLLDLLPREAHLYTYPAGYSDAMSVSSRSSYDYFPERDGEYGECATPVDQHFAATQCQKNMSMGDFEDSLHDYEAEGRVMEP